MRKQLTYILFLILAAVACEEVYNPVLEEVENLLVVEAILISNQSENYIHLYETLGFSEESNSYIGIAGADVYLVDENNNSYKCQEYGSGRYRVNFHLVQNAKYSLLIEVDGETYNSTFQVVPEPPVIDSMITDFVYKTSETGIINSPDDIITEKGIQIYANMDNKGDLNHYRFSSRRILQYYNYYDTVISPQPEPTSLPIYCWNSYYPTGIFNIAGPPEYSTSKSISKHELQFFEQNYNKYIADSLSFAGWIYFIYQYGINEDTYNYYAELNSQLDSDGKIFDPVYVQVVGNITCTSNPEKVVLGNFEISSYSEKRFYLSYSKYKDTITSLRNIPYFYNIPEKGEIKNSMPDFWESIKRNYPDE